RVEFSRGRLLREINFGGGLADFVASAGINSACDGGDVCIDAVEEIFFVSLVVLGIGQDRVYESVKGVARPRGNPDVTKPLRLLMAQSGDCKLHVGHSKQGIVFTGVDLDRPVLVGAGGSAEAANIPDVKLLRLPGQKALLDLIGESVRIGGGAKGFFGEDRGGLVMPVAIGFGSGEAGNQHIGAELADRAHDIGKRDVVTSPFLESFVSSF